MNYCVIVYLKKGESKFKKDCTFFQGAIVMLLVIFILCYIVIIK